MLTSVGPRIPVARDGYRCCHQCNKRKTGKSLSWTAASLRFETSSSVGSGEWEVFMLDGSVLDETEHGWRTPMGKSDEEWVFWERFLRPER